MNFFSHPLEELQTRFGSTVLYQQKTVDEIPTLWVSGTEIINILSFLKSTISGPYPMLYDLSAVDERSRLQQDDTMAKDFTVVYHLLSFERNAFIRIKVPLQGELPSMPSDTSLLKNANWSEREG
jgi:NADH-quinone oxidoreductase subunit C/D